MPSIDLFCGAGGLTRGLEDAGWDTVVAVDSDPAACESYRTNFPDVELIEGDVSKIDFGAWAGAVDLVAGGPPCQPFSVAGHQRAHQDPRDCIPHFIRAVAEIHPAAFLMENVPGLVSLRHRAYLSHVLQSLEALGYTVSYQVLNAAEYGAAQFRRRVFIVGLLGDQEFEFPLPTHGPDAEQPYVPAAEAIAAAAPDIPNTAIVTYAAKPVLRPRPWDGMLVNGGGRPINLAEPSQTIPASAGGNRTHIVDPDGILVGYHEYLMNGGTPLKGIVEGVRRLTVAESASIQSFDQHHVFLGTQSARYRQVGNAVPPNLAQAVALKLLQQLNN